MNRYRRKRARYLARRGDRECRTCMNARKRAKRAAGLDTLFGQWPGDETDAQLAAALRGSQ